MTWLGAQLYNVAQLLDDGGPGRLMLRVPAGLLPRLNRHARVMAGVPAGAEIRFNLAGGPVTITLSSEGAPCLAEVFRGPFQASEHLVGADPLAITLEPAPGEALLRRAATASGARFDPALLRLVLPYHSPIRLLGIAPGPGARLSPPRPGQTPPVRCLAYGSSITHGRIGVLPGLGWTRLFAAELGVDLLNLGFRGGAHCEPELADYIAERDDWDFAVLELGVNMLADFTPGEFEARVSYFVARIARAHPDKLVFCLSPFPFAGNLDPTGTRAAAFRRIVRQTVAGLAGGRLVYLDGRVFLRDYGGFSADLVHPAPAGMVEIARRLARAVRRRLA